MASQAALKLLTNEGAPPTDTLGAEVVPLSSSLTGDTPEIRRFSGSEIMAAVELARIGMMEAGVIAETMRDLSPSLTVHQPPKCDGTPPPWLTTRYREDHLDQILEERLPHDEVTAQGIKWGLNKILERQNIAANKES